MSKPWMSEEHGQWEVNPDPEGKPLRVNVGANQPVEIDKLFGPLASHLIRVRLEYNNTVDGEWVVERQTLEGDAWIEMARWDCQLGFEELEDE